MWVEQLLLCVRICSVYETIVGVWGGGGGLDVLEGVGAGVVCV